MIDMVVGWSGRAERVGNAENKKIFPLLGWLTKDNRQ